MIKTTLTFLTVFICCSCFAQSLTKADITEDLEFLKKTLPLKHTNLFAKLTPTDFEKKVDAIISNAEQLNTETFAVELFKLTKSIGDEHTFVEQKYTTRLPIQFSLFKEGVFVTGIHPDYSVLLNAKLISINNKSTVDIIALFKEVFQSENPSYFDSHLLHYINNPAFLRGLGIMDSDKEAEFLVEAAAGRRTKIRLNATAVNDPVNFQIATAETKLLSKQQKGNYWYDYNLQTKTLYFNYSKCQEEEGKPFANFYRELLAFIASKKPEKLVLDLRYNSGGNSAILEPFIEDLKSSYLNQKGKLFVLIGNQTFSSAVMNAIELKRNSKAIFIGEPSSGNINHYGEVRGFTLPKSKIVIAYSTKYWENWPGKKGPLIPDFTVQYSIKNYMDGKDEALLQIAKF